MQRHFPPKNRHQILTVFKERVSHTMTLFTCTMSVVIKIQSYGVLYDSEIRLESATKSIPPYTPSDSRRNENQNPSNKKSLCVPILHLKTINYPLQPPLLMLLISPIRIVFKAKKGKVKV